ncbi:MAG: signal peptidase II [Acidobacteriaceae bacterium]|nr:signal peptidase II [Acidobacteriaceae bacterium]
MTEQTTQPVVSTEPRRKERNYLAIFALIAAAVVALDRITKRLVVEHIAVGDTHTVIPHVFRISHVFNTGAAFSVFENSGSPDLVRKALIAFSVVAVILVGYMLVRCRRSLSLTAVALSLILGGAIGNLYDRIAYHHVIDFLEVHIIHYHWPDFNVADSCIVIGACLLVLEILRPQRRA